MEWIYQILINQQWKRVHDAYLYCVSQPKEKELLDQLIKKHIEFTKFKKQGFAYEDYYERSEEYKEKLQAIENQLKGWLTNRLEEKKKVNQLMNEVTRILIECEEIANWQLELEDKIKAKSLLLEKQKQLSQITFINSNISTNQGSIVIGSIFGDQTNFSQNIQSSELPTKFITYRTKRASSLSAKSQDKIKSIKLNKEKEIKEYQSEPMEIDYNPFFTPQLVQNWVNLGFTYQEFNEWINIGLFPTDYEFAYWLKSIKQLTSEQMLNYSNEKELRREFAQWNQTKLQAQIAIPPK